MLTIFYEGWGARSQRLPIYLEVELEQTGWSSDHPLSVKMGASSLAHMDRVLFKRETNCE